MVYLQAYNGSVRCEKQFTLHEWGLKLDQAWLIIDFERTLDQGEKKCREEEEYLIHLEGRWIESYVDFEEGSGDQERLPRLAEKRRKRSICTS